MAEERKTVEKAYQNYLKLGGLKESEMHPVQRTETKRAFFAGFGACMAEMSNLEDTGDETTIVEQLEGMQKEIKNYYALECLSKN